MIRDLIKKNRSYRRFYEDETIEPETLMELIDLARLSASAANLQPLKYILSHDPATNALIFPRLSWAGYLKGAGTPPRGERPSAYIIILGDTEISKTFWCDHGIAAQSILLGATEMGLGGCMIGAIDRDGLRRDLNIPSRYKILLAIALGKPKETVIIETVGKDGDIKYWRDTEGRHHVPKRKLDELILNLSYDRSAL
ncbi:MAG: nitroreductase family protein [Candidatus Syntrophoarchaeum caldarius]|uniref:Nitroreductase family protein n=1 Tax=Candidatus Syntropharchaeum caldarium TaxID=1838285 RepID=A0A1F2P7N1_9EURY|nr:MAG: nitroreductase family protein [Candidatus Syntrophoarchaeum caldarius]